jgi:diguanylate cyclase (GGDEF)-like protein/PAS domain S-box-containing protein
MIHPLKRYMRRFSTRLISMTLVAGLLPIVIFGILLNIYGPQVRREATLSIEEGAAAAWQQSEAILLQTAESFVRERAASTAGQVDLYLQTHRSATLKDLQRNAAFRALALQSVGDRGCTALYETSTGINRFHRDGGMENADTEGLSERFPQWWAIIRAGMQGTEAGGHYLWPGPDGAVEERFMYLLPLKERTADGVALSVAASCDIGELKSQADIAEGLHRDTTRGTVAAVASVMQSFGVASLTFMALSVLVSVVFAALMGRYFSRAVDQLRAATKEVNSGNLVPTLKPLMGGEMGELVDDFNGMVLRLAETTVSKEILEESEERYRTAIEYSSDGIAIMRGDVCLYANPMFARIFGYENSYDVIGQALSSNVHPDDRQIFRDMCRQERPGDEAPSWCSFRGIRRDGDELFIEMSAVTVFYREEELSLCYLHDVTERRRAQEKLRYLSLHDALTDCYNRAYFEEELRRLETGRFDPVGLIVCDVDGLKIVNDTLGHGKGDRLLTAVAGLLKGAVRESDVVARIGGDEFAVLLPESPQKVVEEVCFRIRKAVEAYNDEHHPIYMGLSMGCSVKADEETTMEELYTEADNEMYKEKAALAGKNRKTLSDFLGRTTVTGEG